jgi:nicotinamide-nucleotide amidase
MRPFRTAEIIAVGSELLTPFRSDTNSLLLTARLNDWGITVAAKAVAGDDVGPLAALVIGALTRVDLVITSGGLGPTDDDVTRQAVAAALDLTMTTDQSVLASIAARFARRGIPMPPNNVRQAHVPTGAVVLPNPVGTAPGLWIDAGERAVVLLPGPPREMRALLDGDVGARLRARSGGRKVMRRVIRITGRAESAVDDVAAPLYRPWRSESMPIETTILAASGQIELHLSATGEDDPAVGQRLDAAVQTLTAALGDVVFSIDGRSIEEVVGAALVARGLTMAVAESCTGGRLMGRLTDVPGSSAYMMGGVVAYDNRVKIDQLGVPAAAIAVHGAVSEQVAVAMAEGVRARLATDVGVAVTGIAGPSGGTVDKPVGTVVIAVAGVDATVVRTLLFVGDRATIRAQSTQTALDMVRRSL